MTTSADEWADELLHLDQLLVEGFEKKWLNAKATELSQAPQSAWGSLRTLQACLVGLGFEETVAAGTLKPLFELHDYRSKLKGHASGTDAVAIKKKVRTEYKTFTAHFKSLCAACDEALGAVASALGSPLAEGPGE